MTDASGGTVVLYIRDTSTGERLRESVSAEVFRALCERVDDPYAIPIDELRSTIREIRREYEQSG